MKMNRRNLVSGVVAAAAIATMKLSEAADGKGLATEVVDQVDQLVARQLVLLVEVDLAGKDDHTMLTYWKGYVRSEY